MKRSVGVIVLIALAVGYLLGTEHGRSQKEIILVKLGRGGSDAADDEVAVAETSV